MATENAAALTTPGQLLTKTITFTGASTLGLHATGTTIGTIAGGMVEIIRIAGRATTTLTGTGTLSLGVTGSLALFIGTTTGTSIATTAPIWISTTPTANGLAFPAAVGGIAILTNVIVQSNDAANDITGGVLEMNILWRAITPGATLT